MLLWKYCFVWQKSIKEMSKSRTISLILALQGRCAQLRQQNNCSNHNRDPDLKEKS